jgi:lysophospholipase L1-like esterase
MKPNGEDSENIKNNLANWLKKTDTARLSIVHWNCGLHDIKRPFGATENQVPIDRYRANLGEILDLLQHLTPARILWATTTPVIYARHHATKPFDRFEEDVRKYNAAARSVMEARGVPINDLNQVIIQANPADCILPDGVHMTAPAYQLLANAVVEFALSHLAQ